MRALLSEELHVTTERSRVATEQIPCVCHLQLDVVRVGALEGIDKTVIGYIALHGRPLNGPTSIPSGGQVKSTSQAFRA